MEPAGPLWTVRSRSRVESAWFGRLATVRPDGSPHVVPVTFALHGDTVVTAVDHKPKSTTVLQRLINIDADPRVSLLVDHEDADWSQLWWVRLDGEALVVHDEPERTALLAPLLARYAAYRDRPPAGPVVVVRITTVTSWSASG